MVDKLTSILQFLVLFSEKISGFSLLSFPFFIANVMAKSRNLVKTLGNFYIEKVNDLGGFSKWNGFNGGKINP